MKQHDPERNDHFTGQCFPLKFSRYQAAEFGISGGQVKFILPNIQKKHKANQMRADRRGSIAKYITGKSGRLGGYLRISESKRRDSRPRQVLRPEKTIRHFGYSK